MRFKSSKVDGFQVFAVSGVNTISFAIDATEAAKKGLLGFAVERIDPQEKERYFMPGFKVFSSIIPNPDEHTQVSSFNHPIQSFAWDDFTAKDGYTYEYLFYPLRGTAKNLDRSAKPIQIKVKAEKLFSKEKHDIFFNRGVASSQAYTRKFGNKKPNELPADKSQKAMQWLSRHLDDAILAFIEQAKKGDGLLCCFYEFRYLPVAEALAKAIKRGVDVQLIIDGKRNESVDKKTGTLKESFPREENLRMLKEAKIPKANVHIRTARTSAIQHNKFMVLLKGNARKPEQTLTGSTNISEGGIHGQTNVGHWVRDAATAKLFADYWEMLSHDPGATDNDDTSSVRKKNLAFRKAVEAMAVVPTDLKSIPKGISSVFSPRTGISVLDLYVDLLDQAQETACITLAFGINKNFKAMLKDNTANEPLIFMLLEKEDKPSPRSIEPFVKINASNNVYKAWGSYIDTPVFQWAKETNAKALALNFHVSYVHSKFLLRDPLSKDPIIVTGSANFSTASTNENDENMLIIRGDQRVADIYFTEFNRLFNHYYFRSVLQATKKFGNSSSQDSLFLKEKSAEWLSKYSKTGFKQKRLDIYKNMEGFTSLK